MLLTEKRNTVGGGSGLEGRIRSSVSAMLNLRCYQTSRWRCHGGSRVMSLEFRTEVGAEGWRREEE